MKKEFEVVIFEKGRNTDDSSDHEHIITRGHNEEEAVKKAIKVFRKFHEGVEHDVAEINEIKNEDDKEFYKSYMTIDGRGNKQNDYLTGRSEDSERERFVGELLDLLYDYTGCGIQHNGCPCNSCFHTFCACLGLSDEMAHKFWQVVLVLRGDYTEKQIKKYEKERGEA